jgi:hypothetical protein
MTSLLSIVAHVGEPSPLRAVPNELLSCIFVLLCSCGDPIQLPYFRDGVPHQVTISQVCSRWRQIALNTGTLWSNVGISHRVASDHSRCLSIYRIWVGRAGSLPLTVALTYYNLDLLLEFVVPFRLRTLDISLWYSDLSALSDLPNLDVEEFAISLIDRYDGRSDLELPQLVMDRTRYISFQGLCGTMPKSEAMLNVFSSLWRQLRSLECDSIQVSLTAWLNVLHQAQSLEHCDLTIVNVGNGPLVKVSMPNLRSFILNLLELELHPDIVIPLIAAPNITTLCIFCPDTDWSSDTYNIIKQHHKLHQLHEIHLFTPRTTLHITQILEDAPMVRSLRVDGRSILDDEGLEGIASGRLGRCLTLLHLADYFGQAGKWLNMIESRQRNVKSMVAQVSNWQQLFTGIREVELWNVEAVESFEGRITTLKVLGTNARISGYYSEKCSGNESAI